MRSRLVNEFLPTWSHDELHADFVDMAIQRFKRHCAIVSRDVGDEITARKRKRANKLQTAPAGKRAGALCASSTSTKDAEKEEEEEEGVCAVCLDSGSDCVVRCERKQCKSLVCNSCHIKMRGLCAICDRTAINADYPCSSCHTVVRLQQYGYRCLCCKAHSMCERCYCAFRMCAACDEVSTSPETSPSASP